MMTFAQRQGYKPVPTALGKEAMPSELRTSLWNVLDVYLWTRDDFYFHYDGRSFADQFTQNLWCDFLKWPMDQRNTRNIGRVLEPVREYFFAAEWFDVYEFVEFTATQFRSVEPKLDRAINHVLERELAAYRMISGVLVDVTSEQEIAALQEALADTRFSGVHQHLSAALKLLSDKQHPDYRNCIKESISAVEAMARAVSGKPKATLGDALKAIDSKALHPALRAGFEKLYGYTNDADGIRHALSASETVSQADAKYFLLSCTSFINYLKANLPAS